MVFLKCDFGPWKHVYRPRLVQDRADGLWHCFWDLTPDGSAMGCASSSDLIRWTPQEFFMSGEQSRHEVKDGRMPVADTVQVGDKTIAGYALKVPYRMVEGLNAMAYTVLPSMPRGASVPSTTRPGLPDCKRSMRGLPWTKARRNPSVRT